jgi:hypothetical protein
MKKKKNIKYVDPQRVPIRRYSSSWFPISSLRSRKNPCLSISTRYQPWFVPNVRRYRSSRKDDTHSSEKASDHDQQDDDDDDEDQDNSNPWRDLGIFTLLVFFWAEIFGYLRYLPLHDAEQVRKDPMVPQFQTIQLVDSFFIRCNNL